MSLSKKCGLPWYLFLFAGNEAGMANGVLYRLCYLLRWRSGFPVILRGNRPLMGRWQFSREKQNLDKFGRRCALYRIETERSSTLIRRRWPQVNETRRRFCLGWHIASVNLRLNIRDLIDLINSDRHRTLMGELWRVRWFRTVSLFQVSKPMNWPKQDYWGALIQLPNLLLCGLLGGGLTSLLKEFINLLWHFSNWRFNRKCIYQVGCHHQFGFP